MYYICKLKSPYVAGSAKFNKFRNRSETEGFVRVGLGGLLDRVEIEEISELAANDLKHGPLEEIDGGVHYGLDPADYRRMHSVWYRVLRNFLIAVFLFVLTTVSVTATSPTVRHYKSSREAFNGPDRTITWRPWHESPDGHFQFRTGDRYLGGQVWEHYLGFELQQTSIKAIKLSMIRLASADIQEEVVIRPGLRYAILKVTNGTMTARKGVWSWTAQEVH